MSIKNEISKISIYHFQISQSVSRITLLLLQLLLLLLLIIIITVVVVVVVVAIVVVIKIFTLIMCKNKVFLNNKPMTNADINMPMLEKPTINRKVTNNA